MTIYQLIKQEEETIYKLVKAGIITYTIIRDISIYQRFEELAPMNKESRYLIIGDENELSLKRVQQVVLNMERKIN